MDTAINKKMTLILYTMSFPYGKGETFLENEIPILSKEFDNIIIVPNSKKVGVEDQDSMEFDNIDRVNSLPENCFIMNIESDYSNFAGGAKLLKSIGLFSFMIKFMKFTPYLINAIKLDYQSFIKSPREFVFVLFNIYLRSDVIYKNLYKYDERDISIHYSYWMYEWATILSILKDRGKIELLISRGHGNDIYIDNRGAFKLDKNGRKIFGSYNINYRKYELSNIDYLYTISNKMKRYMIDIYPEFKYKIRKSYLGVPDRGLNSSYRDKIRLVSVSNVIPLKRVDKIIDILKNIDFEIEWIHFGSGPLYKDLEDKVNLLNMEHKNIKVKLFGRVSNKKVIEFYQTNHVTLFINVSVTEGLPVSIMEALSMGIPIIATDVGGTAEAIPESSFLIPVDFDAKKVSEIIYNIARLEQSEYIKMREDARKIYIEKFNANKNYTKFCRELKSFIKDKR